MKASANARLKKAAAKGWAAATRASARAKEASASARVKATFASGDKEIRYVLLNPLTAPVGTPLYSLARYISRLENLSHVLVWGERRGVLLQQATSGG